MNDPQFPGISVVILNYNTADLLNRFIPAVLNSTYSNMEVWVVDNASDDHSVELVKAGFPQVKTLVLDANYGFAEGYNRALAQISNDYYVLLNSDVEVSPGWLEPMLNIAMSDDKIAAIQPKILDYKYRDRFEYAGACGGYLDKFIYPFCRGRLFDTLETDSGQYDDSVEIFWASGACMFIRAEAFHKAGGLDSDFFAHMEEIDLCWRLKRLGYRNYVVPQSVVWHMGGGTLANGTGKKYYLNYRNNLIMMIKNLPAYYWFFAMLWRMVLDGISALRFLLQGKWFVVRAICKAHAAIWSRLRYWRSKCSADLPGKVSFKPYSVVWAYFIAKKSKYSQLP